jgi:hypothetical protein
MAPAYLLDKSTNFTPGDHQLQALTTTLDQVVAWSEALAPLRVTAWRPGERHRPAE